MERKPVNSSNLISVGYDLKSKTLEIEFKNGIYQYIGVPIGIYESLMKAQSKGKYFHRFIRGRFPDKKVS